MTGGSAITTFGSLVRDLILRDAVNYGLWDSTEGARDLTRALAWYLGQNPLPPLRRGMRQTAWT